MKRYLKCIIMTLALLLVINSQGVLAQTLPSNVHLVGDEDGILISLPEGETDFLYKEGMLPGDSVDREMFIENKYDRPYTLYIRAERITEKEQYDLLTKLNLKINYDGEIIYDGPVSGEDGMANDIELGTFQPGDKAELYAVVTLDGLSTGDEYMNKEGVVDWIFTATNENSYPENPEEPQNPDESNNPDGSQKPGGSNKPGNTDKSHGSGKGTNNSPKTGDSSVVTYTAMAAGSFILLLVVGRKNRKESKEA